jgi:hypothetical protein
MKIHLLNFFNDTIDGINKANKEIKTLSYKIENSIDIHDDVSEDDEDFENFDNYTNHNQDFDTICNFVINNINVVLKKLEEKKDDETISLILDRFCLKDYYKKEDKEVKAGG